MITIIARWEDAQMLPQYEYQLWRQLKGAFEVNRIIYTGIVPNIESYQLEQYATMEEALAVAVGARVFLEPTGTKGLLDIPTGDIVLITGNTNNNNLVHAQAGETYKIASPASTHLYPSEAAAIALAVRYGQ